METTIKVSGDVKKHLDRMKVFERETYNGIIELLIENNLELNEKTKRELRERERNPVFVSHEEVGKKLGL